jgi:hypothetical protein
MVQDASKKSLEQIFVRYIEKTNIIGCDFGKLPTSVKSCVRHVSDMCQTILLHCRASQHAENSMQMSPTVQGKRDAESADVAAYDLQL